jgi:hypothetical protein
VQTNHKHHEVQPPAIQHQKMVDLFIALRRSGAAQKSLPKNFNGFGENGDIGMVLAPYMVFRHRPYAPTPCCEDCEMKANAGIKKIVRESRRLFRTPENRLHYSEKDFEEAERKFVKFMLQSGGFRSMEKERRANEGFFSRLKG